ncbi:hypothetical protein [Cupriavidus sp. YAF13]|uniref:hypothetical protein n=1 Tax=Cupriavidus sp. YAF13 TaxID=3233075 RepID=UPI003F90311B
MAMSILFNGHTEDIASLEELRHALGRFDDVPQFELWVSVPDGPSICMLRNCEHAWLMYLRHEGDSGFTSIGEASQLGNEKYILSNGQKDEYPVAWCIEVEQCYKVIAYFYVNDGARPEWIQWLES